MNFASILQTIKRLFSTTFSLWRNFLRELESYLLGKAKHRPEVLPLGRRVVIESILDKKKNQEFLHQFSQESGIPQDQEGQIEKTFRGYLHEIASDLNYLTVPFWDFLLTWVFDLVYEGLEVNTTVLEKIRPLVGQKPIIFVPNHRSHMDYLILSYVFYNQRLTMPYVCAGANLSFWPMGPLFRRAGGFFIRRSYDGNKLYAHAVSAYLSELLEQNFNIEFFIEGGRSRTGKLLPPKMGILSAIVQAHLEGVAPDVIFVPTSITYESILEETSYLQEQAGGSKKEENFWDLFRLQKYLRKKKGKVYLEFGEPVSLQQYSQDFSGERRELVNSLAYELTYGINKSAVVTPASLVATSILTHRGRSLSESDAEKKISLYLHYLRHKKCHLSQTLLSHQKMAIKESFRNYVRQNLIKATDAEEEGILYTLLPEKRPLLNYYKNTSLHFFVSLAVLATILQTYLLKEERISLSEVEKEYAFLQELFKYEFTFSRRQERRLHLEKLLEYLQGVKVLVLDQEEIQLTDEAKTFLPFFSSCIRSFLEGYYILWMSLPRLKRQKWESRNLIDYLKKRGMILYLKEEILEIESFSKSTLQNALWSFRDMGLIEEKKEGTAKKTKIYYRINDTIKEDVEAKLRQYVTIYVHTLSTTCG